MMNQLGYLDHVGQKGTVFASALLKVKPEHSDAALLVLECLLRNQSRLLYDHLSPGTEDYMQRSIWA
jgi:hypothetical protein